MIDTPTLRKLAEMGHAPNLTAKGVPGGYILVLHSMDEEALKAQRGGARLFRRLDTIANYLSDLGISRFEVDSSSWSEKSLLSRKEKRYTPNRS